MNEKYSLVTNLLQPESYPVLVDWFEFLPYPPENLICFCGGNRTTESLVRELCIARGVTLLLAPNDLTEDIRKDDLPVIRWQFENTTTPWCIRVALDTIPYSTDQVDWLSTAITAMRTENRLFLTGSTRNYRADQRTSLEGMLLTKRVSLNFLLVQPDTWLDTFDRFVSAQPTYKRYYTEGALEHYCADKDVWGLRLENTAARRIFHVQEWGERIGEIRLRFREGHRISPFLSGFTDDETHPWDRYYMYPKPSAMKLARIAFGAWRRGVFGAR